jgi:hypothetical protein
LLNVLLQLANKKWDSKQKQFEAHTFTARNKQNVQNEQGGVALGIWRHRRYSADIFSLDKK